ncbi:hypothetical protein FA95DRAFT_123802 [Auriscalpium vulgare]|uniref:Uncharacterized protein n=1 Tax=Auriscalpium vulgare TaxID=40419 RepID=A0ACB8RP98_9AGAM|nr:hypothetical protein FA95DRAFT_123802 [Auriscalpium vulgare]
MDQVESSEEEPVVRWQVIPHEHVPPTRHPRRAARYLASSRNPNTAPYIKLAQLTTAHKSALLTPPCPRIPSIHLPRPPAPHPGPFLSRAARNAPTGGVVSVHRASLVRTQSSKVVLRSSMLLLRRQESSLGDPSRRTRGASRAVSDNGVLTVTGSTDACSG